MCHFVISPGARLALCALLMLGGAAARADALPYVGAGYAFVNLDREVCDNPLTECESENEDGFQIFGGYQFNRHFALEIGYVQARDFAIGRDINSIVFDTDNNLFSVEVDELSHQLSSTYLAAIGRLPLTDSLTLTGRFGIHEWEIEAARDVCIGPKGPIGNPPPRGCAEEGTVEISTVDGASVLYGVGAEYDFTDRLRFQIGWANFDGNGADFETVNANFIVKLRPDNR